MWLAGLDEVRPGTALGQPVLDGNGRVLLNAGIALTERYLGILRDRGYTRIFVRDAAVPVDALADEDLPPRHRTALVEALAKAHAALEQYIGQPRIPTIQDMIAVCRAEAMRPLLQLDGPIGRIGHEAAALVKALRGRTVLAATPLCLPGDDGSLHGAVNAAVAAALIAERAGLHDAQVLRITHGALLHNIGRVFLRHRLDPRDHERDMAVLGYELLKHCGESGLLVAHCAFEQFEHVDGTGRPRGLTGANTIERGRRQGDERVLTLNGEICAVAVVYDRLINGTPGHPPVTALEARHALATAAGSRYNRAVVDTLLKMLPPFPCGTEVSVTGGKHAGWSGVVDEVNPKAIERPAVVLYRRPDGTLARPIEVDTARFPDITLAPYRR